MRISQPDPLWADLLNSDWRDYRGGGAREDRIANDRWLIGFLARAGGADKLPAEAERRLLRRLRSLLRRMVNALIAGQELQGGDLKTLNVFMSATPIVPRLEKTGSGWRLAQTPSSAGVVRAASAGALSFASMLAEGDPTRIKTCANPDCGWVIYDASHNRTRRWCDVKECGNLIKVRQFRARRRRAS